MTDFWHFRCSCWPGRHWHYKCVSKGTVKALKYLFSAREVHKVDKLRQIPQNGIGLIMHQ